jgi:hypothetical protein
MQSRNGNGKIALSYGRRQTFQHRCEDIHISGFTSLTLPTRRSEWRLNGGPPVHFYVERNVTSTDPPQYPWQARTPAVNRLRDLPGHFNIEIPINCPLLRPGNNHIALAIEGNDGHKAALEAEFYWDPKAVALPLDLSDLSKTESIQNIGQAVNGFWDVDRDRNAITTRAPVGDDSLLLLGAPHESQEATYEVVFGAPFDGVFIGLSDFFVRHDEQQPELGIKPGYSTAGLATITASRFAECWSAMGDSTWDKEWSWVKKSVPAFIPLKPGVDYAVRHQVIFDSAAILARFRIWLAGTPEPRRWLSTIDTVSLSPELPRPKSASFGLFQHRGSATRWSNIKVRQLQAKICPEDIAPSHSLLEECRKVRDRVRCLSESVIEKARQFAAASDRFATRF